MRHFTDYYYFSFSGCISRPPVSVRRPLKLDIDVLPRELSWGYRFGSSSLVSRKNRTCDILVTAIVFSHAHVSKMALIVSVPGNERQYTVESRTVVTERGKMYSAFCAEVCAERIVLNAGDQVSFTIRLADDSDDCIPGTKAPAVLKPTFEVTIRE